MRNRARLLRMRLAFLLALTACSLSGAEPSPITVQGRRLTFDPKTATPAKAGFGWGLGSLSVTILPRQGNQCRFDYQWEVEGAGNYQVHQVAVPLDSGPVVIDAADRRDPEHTWSGVYTSFTKDQAKLIREARFGWFVEPLEGARESITYRGLRPGSAGRPWKPDDRVQVRCLLFLEFQTTFENLAPSHVQPKPFVVPLTGDTPWKWVQHLLQEMTLYEIRQVRLPSKVAGPAKQWLPGYTDRDQREVFIEVQALAVEGR